MADLGSYPVDSNITDTMRVVVYDRATGQPKLVPMAEFREMCQATFIKLPDTPGTFIGKQGKVPQVNAEQTALEFVSSSLAPAFITLPDTPEAYSTSGYFVRINPTNNGLVFEPVTFTDIDNVPDTLEAGRIVKVNPAGDALVFDDYDFTSLGDTPVDYSGATGFFVVVNQDADGLEFREVKTETIASTGWFDYNHSGTTQAYTGGSGYVKLLNDEAAPFTNKSYPPPGVTDLWDSTTQLFDWSELSLGDTIDIRIDMEVTTTAVNQEIGVDLWLADGSGIEYEIPFSYSIIKAAGANVVNRFNGIYMGNDETRLNGAYFRFRSDANATVKVNGWYCRVIRRGV